MPQFAITGLPDRKEEPIFLDYFALVVLLMGLVLVFYTFVYIHDLPHKIAKQREHPQEEAIHVACWVSLFPCTRSGRSCSSGPCRTRSNRKALPRRRVRTPTKPLGSPNSKPAF